MVVAKYAQKKKQSTSIARLEDNLHDTLPFVEGLVLPEFVDPETKQCIIPEEADVPALDRKYFPLAITFKHEKNFDQYDDTLMRIIQGKLKERWFMVVARRMEVQGAEGGDCSGRLCYLLGVTELWLELNAERQQCTLPRRDAPAGMDVLYMPYSAKAKDCYATFDGNLRTDCPTSSVFTPSMRLSIMHQVLEEAVGSALSHSPVKGLVYLHNPEELTQISHATGNIMFRPLLSYSRRVIFIEYVRRYFGERRGLYFAFLIFYTLSLVPISLAGLVAFPFSSVKEVRPFVEPVWVALIVMWTASWLLFWIRTRNDWAFKWGTRGFKEAVRERPQFNGITRFNPVTHEKERYYPRWKRVLLRYSVSSFVVALMVTCSCLIVLSCIIFRAARALPTFWSYKVAGFMMGLTSNLGNYIMSKVAKILTDFENHRDEHTWENAFILKIFSVYSVNTFLYFYYVTFLQGRLKSLFGLDAWWDLPCPDDNCVVVLETLVCYHMIANLFVQQAFEIGRPWLIYYVSRRFSKASVGTDGGVNSSFFTYVDTQLKKDPFNVFHDYAELVLQFGVVTLFAAAFPLAPVLALINNICEIYFDFYKYAKIGGRPRPQKAEDIGTWLLCIKVTAFFSILTNCGYLCFVSTTASVRLRHQSWVAKTMVFFFLEHIFLIIQMLFYRFLPHESFDLQERLKLADAYYRVELEEERKQRDREYKALAEERSNLIKARMKVDEDHMKELSQDQMTREVDPLLGKRRGGKAHAILDLIRG